MYAVRFIFVQFDLYERVLKILSATERHKIAKVSSRCLHYFTAAILVILGGTPTWRLHTGLCKFVQNISTNIFEDRENVQT